MSTRSRTELEDLYLPYKPKRRTKATIAKERGLEPLAELIWAQDRGLAGTREALAAAYVDVAKEVPSVEAAWQGARDIIAERVASDVDVRQALREIALERTFSLYFTHFALWLALLLPVVATGSVIFLAVRTAITGTLGPGAAAETVQGSMAAAWTAVLVWGLAGIGGGQICTLLVLDRRAHPGVNMVLLAVLRRHDAAAVSQLDAFEAYLADPAQADSPLGRWTQATLTDPVKPVDAMAAVRRRFPHALTLDWRPEGGAGDDGRSYAERTRARSDAEVAAAFVEHVRSTPTDGERQVLQQALEVARRSEDAA